MATKKSIAAVAGGRTPEHDLSVQSARRLSAALGRSGYELTTVVIDEEGSEPVPTLFSRLASFDYVLPLVHGDPAVSGLLAMLDVPILGEGPGPGAVALDKPTAKRLLRDAGLPVLPGLIITRRELASSPRDACQRVAREVGLPCFVKPASGVASIGACPVHDFEHLMAALVTAATFDARVLVEPWIDAREIEVGVLAGLPSAPGELVFRAEFHDYATKREPDRLELIVPAMLDAADRDRLRAMAASAASSLGLEVVGRVEFLVDRNTHRLTINEVNAVPAFHPGASFARIWEASGLGIEGQVDRMAAAADARVRERFRTRHRAAAPDAALRVSSV